MYEQNNAYYKKGLKKPLFIDFFVPKSNLILQIFSLTNKLQGFL